MKKEWLLLIASVAGSVLLALGLIQWLAPQLLRMPGDLRLVQVSEEVPPFYENVFRAEDAQTREFLINDPYTLVRAKPWVPQRPDAGPHDLLGFRNRAVPNVADIVTIGDSQTYGNNVVLSQNWPSQLTTLLEDKNPRQYNMATGGWGAVQYLDMFTNATLFRPRVVVVAFYTGNDPLDSFRVAYGLDRWSMLRPDPTLDLSDLPKVAFPPPREQWWRVDFDDGVSTTFTPHLRYVSNEDGPAVRAGYAVMAEVARQIAVMAKPLAVELVFTIIPTKELVYAEKIASEGIDAPQDYRQLVAAERENLDQLAAAIRALPEVSYVDVLAALQEAALTDTALYLPSINGHPISAGYRVIADTLAPAVDRHLPAPPPRGLVAVKDSGDSYTLHLIKNDGIWLFDSRETIVANGWTSGPRPLLSPRDIAQLPFRGVVRTTEPERFGPPAFAQAQ